MTATYRIKELPSGMYLLEKAVPDSELWIHVWEYPTYSSATAGMERAIVMATWLFDQDGNYLDKGGN